MKVLITGGAGFIGSHLADTCHGRGDEVHVLDDLSTGHPDRARRWASSAAQTITASSPSRWAPFNWAAARRPVPPIPASVSRTHNPISG